MNAKANQPQIMLHQHYYILTRKTAKRKIAPAIAQLNRDYYKGKLNEQKVLDAINNNDFVKMDVNENNETIVIIS